MAAPRLFHRLFIANRGEVAVRIARACDDLGIEPVFAVSEADLDAPYLSGREYVCLGPARSAQSYLDPVRVVQAAVQRRCSALHPGWGFLAENPLLATLARTHGVTFVGPSAEVMALMGKKTPAKRAMAAAGLQVIPGSEGTLGGVEEAQRLAAAIGVPVLLKAEAGGGGRGMRVAHSLDGVAQAYAEAASESMAAFGDDRLYLEKLIEGGRHVEVQIMADAYGTVVHLGERDCTIQRNHQKLVEESPSPLLDDEERARTSMAAANAARSIGYVGAGTMEMLMDSDGHLRFMEMNTRLQVEHSVTEMRAGVDLVREQIRVAAGHPLSFAQEDVRLVGHAIECRINAEDPVRNFQPSPGRIRKLRLPEATADLRIDTHIAEGYEVPPFYDSLICKVIARGKDRDEAADRMIAALDSLVCDGIETTVPMHLAILRSRDFRDHLYDNRTIPGFVAAGAVEPVAVEPVAGGTEAKAQ